MNGIFGSSTSSSATTQLTIVHRHLKSCFVNIPPAWASTICQNNQIFVEGIVTFELSWKETTSSEPSSNSNKSSSKRTTRTVAVGWLGGVCTYDLVSEELPSLPFINGNSSSNSDPNATAETNTLEIDTHFAQVLGLKAGQIVNVRIVKPHGIAKSINVEPYSSDDWEIMELHAGYLESRLLSQIKVTSNQQVFAVWINQQAIARLRIVDTDPSTPLPLVLAADSEVIVAPKSRNALNETVAVPTEEESNTPKQRMLLTLRALPPRFAEREDVADVKDLVNTVYIPQSIFNVLHTGQSSHHIMYLRKSSPLSSASEPRNMASSRGNKRGTYVLVKPSKRIPEGHVFVSNNVLNELEIEVFGKVKLIDPLQRPVSKVRKIVLHKVESHELGSGRSKLTLKVDTQSSASSSRLKGKMMAQSENDLLIHSFREVVQNDAALLISGEEMTLPGVDKKVVVCLNDECPLLKGEDHFEHRVRGKKKSVTFGMVKAKDMVDDVDVELGQDIVDYRYMSKTAKPFNATPKLSVKSVPRPIAIDEQVDKCLNHFINSIGRRNRPSSLGVSSMLLTGSSGTGKSGFVKYIGETLSLHSDCLAYPIYVPCGSLTAHPLPNLQAYFQSLFTKAQYFAPSIMTLDDLDLLCPLEQEHTDPSRTRMIVSILSEFMSNSPSTIGILATVKHETNLHTGFSEKKLLGEWMIEFKSLDKKQRGEILETLLNTTLEEWRTFSRNNETLETMKLDLDINDMVNQTDGFVMSDLVVLLERTKQEALIRVSQSESDVLTVTSQDFTRARKDYVPSRLKNVPLTHGHTSWSDIGGLTGVKKILLETLEWPTKYAPIFQNNCSLRLRSGLLLFGYPGCGKTLLASAVAKECGLNFVSVKGPEILNKYIGASEKAIRDLFERASAAKPCVLFFDEFDAIAPRRGHDNTGVTDRVVNQLLTQMDGAEGLEGVYVLAATSRPDLIDPALLRPGRLDKSLLCGMPSQEERLDILRAVSGSFPLDEAAGEGMLEVLSQRTEGFTGADLKALFVNAQFESVHELLEKEENEDGDVGDNSSGSKSKSKDLKHREETKVVLFESVNGEQVKSKVLVGVERRNVLDKIHGTQDREEKVVDSSQSGADGQTKKSKMSIRLEHLESAVSKMRPSLSANERARFERIYDEFVNGRSVTEANVGSRATLG